LRPKRLMGLLFIAIMMILTYLPLSDEIDTVVNNPNTTSSIAQLMDKIFPIIWWVGIAFVLTLVLYQATQYD